MSNRAVAGLAEVIRQRQEAERKPTPRPVQKEEAVFAPLMGVSPIALEKPEQIKPKLKQAEGLQPSKQAESTQQASNLQATSKQLSVKKLLGMRADVAATFRFPQELLKQLDRAYSRIPERFDARVTRNSVVVAAVAYLLADFEKQEEESLLYRLVVKHEDVE